MLWSWSTLVDDDEFIVHSLFVDIDEKIYMLLVNSMPCDVEGILCSHTCCWCMYMLLIFYIWWCIWCLNIVALLMCEESMLILMIWDQENDLLTKLACKILCYDWSMIMSSWFTHYCWHLSLMRRYIHIVVIVSWVINNGWNADRDLMDD